MSMRIRSAMAASLLPFPAWAVGPPGIEPTYLMLGGAGSFALGVLFGLWLCRRWCKRDNDKKDSYTR